VNGRPVLEHTAKQTEQCSFALLFIAKLIGVNALKRYGAAFVTSKQFRNFLPCFVLSSLLANEVNERFEPTVKGPSTALLGSFFWLRVAHGTVECFIRQHIAARGGRVSE